MLAATKSIFQWPQSEHSISSVHLITLSGEPEPNHVWDYCESLIFDATKVFMFFQQSMQPEELSLFIIFVFVLHLPILAVSHCRSRGEINVAHVPIDSR